MSCWHPANVANTMKTACVLATPAFHNLNKNTIRLPSTLVPPTSYSFGNTSKGERGSRRHQYPVILAAVRKGPEILLVRCYRMAVGIYCTVRKRVVTSLGPQSDMRSQSTSSVLKRRERSYYNVPCTYTSSRLNRLRQRVRVCASVPAFVHAWNGRAAVSHVRSIIVIYIYIYLYTFQLLLSSFYADVRGKSFPRRHTHQRYSDFGPQVCILHTSPAPLLKKAKLF